MSSFQEQALRHREEHLTKLDTAPFPAEIATKIRRYGAPMGAVLEHHACLDRCMNRLQQLMAEAEGRGGVLAAGTTVLADRLSQSQGRFARHWHAPPGGLWLTVAWPDILLPEFSRLLPFAAGLACCRTVRLYGLDARLKWVNDLLINGRKIAGILCTSVVRPSHERYHLLGIGLNANNQDFPHDLQGRAVSMADALGQPVDLAELAGRLLAELGWAVGLLHYDEELALHGRTSCEEGYAPLLLAAWRQLSDTTSRRIVYGFDVQQQPLCQATAVDIDSCGGLIMELEDGSRTVEYSGEIVYLS
ncbi:BPL/LPL catalytic domain-containing protein [Candidatus Electronema halotolerans]